MAKMLPSKSSNEQSSEVLKGRGLLPEAELAFFTSLKAGGKWEQGSRRRIYMPLRLAAFSLRARVFISSGTP